jgi:hypothetical protein
VPGLEPLTIGIIQTDQGNRGLADLGGQSSEAVEGTLGGCVEDLVGPQRRQSSRFLGIGNDGADRSTRMVCGSTP